jgi:DNA-binding MarR family transcriptional regulator
MTLDFDPIAEARRQWENHGWESVDPMSAVTSIVRAQQLAMSAISEVLTPLGLTFSRYEALVLLHFSRAGELPLGKMGDRLMVHPASVTNTVDRLEADGLVERVPHPSDRRTTLARITQEGTAVMEKGTAELVAIEFGVGALSGAELNQLDRLIAVLRSRSGDFKT